MLQAPKLKTKFNMNASGVAVIETAVVEAVAPPAPPRTRRVVLIGNPNVGKSALFNALTGLRATVSNYPGTTEPLYTRQSLLVEVQKLRHSRKA